MVLIATQVKRRRGTTAENDAFTGAEGEITVDTEKHELRVHDGVTQGGFVIGAGGSGAGRNIGDIFYTTRTDTALAGAVECNGGTYSTADYAGAGSIGELLTSGKLPYVSLADYATQITNNGVCGVFGWDGTGTTAFRVPTLQDVFIECGQASELGDYIGAGLPNAKGVFDGLLYCAPYNTSAVPMTGTGVFRDSGTQSEPGRMHVRRDSGSNQIAKLLDFNMNNGSSVYKDEITTVQPEAIKYRAMIQLFNSTTDEAVATVGTVVAQVGTVVAQVGELRNMSNITATGKETAVGWGMPDYSRAISISGSSFTATFPCWLVGYTARSGAGEQVVLINDVAVAREAGDYADVQIMLDSGDVVSVNSGTFSTLTVCPLKGV